jgi:hypothetical protein
MYSNTLLQLFHFAGILWLKHPFPIPRPQTGFFPVLTHMRGTEYLEVLSAILTVRILHQPRLGKEGVPDGAVAGLV